jgi:hypothetical protein
MNFLLMNQVKKDTRAAYGDLGNHLRDLRAKTHMLNVNVVWLCLARHPDEVEPLGRPMIPGQQADKFMAGVHYIFHSRVDQQKRGQELLPPTYEMRTKKYAGYLAGNRLGGKANLLPDPLVGDYQALVKALGYDVDVLRQSMPKISATAAKPQVLVPVQPHQPPPAARPSIVKNVAKPAAS